MLQKIKLRYKNNTHFKRTKQHKTKPIEKKTPNQIEFEKKTRKNQPTKAQFQQNA